LGRVELHLGAQVRSISSTGRSGATNPEASASNGVERSTVRPIETSAGRCAYSIMKIAYRVAAEV
jgi:hypothetical protein